MPESLGSRRRVLPRGVVCDKCNNYFARKVELPILNSTWLRNLRAWHQVPNKKGKFPSLLGHIAGTDIQVNWSKGEDGEMRLSPEKKSDAQALEEVVRGGLETPLLFVMQDDVPDDLMPRFLAKMGLETVAERYASDLPTLISRVVDEPAWDEIRDFARQGSLNTIWPVSKRRVYPVDTLMTHPDTGAWVQAGFGCRTLYTRRRETYFAFCIYGMEFVINLGGPSVRGYKEWLHEHSDASPFVEGLSYRLVEKDGKTYLEQAAGARSGEEQGIVLGPADSTN